MTAVGAKAPLLYLAGENRSGDLVAQLATLGIDAEMTVWQAILAPAATPPALRQAIHAAIARVLAEPALRNRFSELGADRVLGLDPDESQAYVNAENTRWEAILRAAALP